MNVYEYKNRNAPNHSFHTARDPQEITLND